MKIKKTVEKYRNLFLQRCRGNYPLWAMKRLIIKRVMLNGDVFFMIDAEKEKKMTTFLIRIALIKKCIKKFFKEI